MLLCLSLPRKLYYPEQAPLGGVLTDLMTTTLYDMKRIFLLPPWHCAAYTFDGEDIFICHGYSAPKNGAALLIQRTITWTSDGWPELKPFN